MTFVGKFLASLVLCQLSYAAEMPGAMDSSEFEIEPGLVDKIFDQNAKASQLDSSDDRNGWTVSAALSFFNPEKFALNNPYFDIDYTQNIKSLPNLRMTVDAPIGSWKGFELEVTGRVSYSFRESLFAVKSKSGVSLTDSIRIHWLPVSAGLTLEYEIPYVPFLRPSLGAGAGLQWIYQQGRLDGLEQGFWLPFSYVEATLTFFPSTDWFTGFRTGASLVQSFGDGQSLRGWSVDVGLLFRL